MTKRRKQQIDFPFEQVRAEADKRRREGYIVFQKWTCRGCGHRLAGAPDAWTAYGQCEDEIKGKMCGYVTDLRRTGCNFTLIMVSDPNQRQKIVEMARVLGPIGTTEGKA